MVRVAKKYKKGGDGRLVRVKPSKEQVTAIQEFAQLRRMLHGGRRPEDVALFREYQIAQFATTVGEMERRWRGIPPTDNFRKHILPLEVNRDILIKALLKQNDTCTYYAGPEFCDLIAATDMPPVVDLSILERIGNQTAFIVFQKNIPVSKPEDAIIGITVHITDAMRDGFRRILGAMIHADDSTSSYQYRFTEEHPGLATVNWGSGYNSRSVTDNTGAEQRILSNVLGLLGAQAITQVTPWNHYTKADRTAAAKAKRKLGSVNVITLQRRAQKDLDEHHEAQRVERDGWWPQRGHFRMQPCGPNRKQRRLAYVSPCVKGNLEGPNIGRIQVHQTV